MYVIIALLKKCSEVNIQNEDIQHLKKIET